MSRAAEDQRTGMWINFPAVNLVSESEGKSDVSQDPAPSKMTGNSSVLDQWLVFLNDGNGNKSSAPQGLTVPS